MRFLLTCAALVAISCSQPAQTSEFEFIGGSPHGNGPRLFRHKATGQCVLTFERGPIESVPYETTACESTPDPGLSL